MTDKNLLNGFDNKKHRLTLKEKEANDYQWFKDKADYYERLHNSNFARAFDFKDVSPYESSKVNYDLYNGNVNMKELSHVLSPYGHVLKNIPVKIRSRDIISPKIKVLLGMEMKRPFSYTVVATNNEAIARKEREEIKKLRDYVVEQTMGPIKEEIKKKKMMEMQAQQEAQAQQQGPSPQQEQAPQQQQPQQPQQQELSQEQKQQLQQEIEQEAKAMTPEEVKHYMKREHKDPVEVMSNQLLRYQIVKLNLKERFNVAFKHMSLSAKEIIYVGVLRDKVVAWNVNSLYFSHDSRRDLIHIEEGDWAVCDYEMTPSQVVSHFELDDDEIDDLYEKWNNHLSDFESKRLFSFTSVPERELQRDTITVRHIVFKALKPIKILTYLDEEGVEQNMFVSETYKRNKDQGDISIKTIWVDETYECWKINDLYKNMGPVTTQYKGIDNIYESKLPYVGVVIDNMNSKEKSIMGRGRSLQYEYDLISFRIDMLVATDKGKKVLMNIGSVPDSAGIDLESWQNFFETSPFMWYNQNEEGYSDANTIAKVIDLSLASDIGKYIEFLRHIREQMGKVMGIPEQMEGDIGANEAVTNTKQTLIQTSHILEPYFNIHNTFKRNVLQAVLDASKVAYHGKGAIKLSYVLDDLSIEILKIDSELLDSSKLSVHVADATKSQEARQTIDELAFAAMQNQAIDMSDILQVLEAEGLTEAKESLKIAEENKRDAMLQQQREQQASQEKMQQMMEAEQERARQHEKDMVILKEEERRKTELQKVAIMGMSFNPEADSDGDGENDFLEIAKYGLDADIKKSKDQLEREKFEHQKEQDGIKNNLDQNKLALEKKKAQMAKSKSSPSK